MSTSLYLQTTQHPSFNYNDGEQCVELFGFSLDRSPPPFLYSDHTMPFKRLRTGEPSHVPSHASKLQIREYIHKCKQRVEAAETTEEDVDVTNDNGSSDGMRLVQLLISCAEAVACRDRAQASALLSELKASALVLGTSFQRVASCFVQGLADRLALVQPLGAVGLVRTNESGAGSAERTEALKLAYEVCPYIRFGHFVANAAIMEAFEEENDSVHVVDLGMSLGLPHGHQWRDLLRRLADREGSPPRRVRITGVSPHADLLDSVGRELENFASGLGLDLEFFGISTDLENLKPEEFAIEEGEAVAISSVLQMHCVVKESRGVLNSVLRVIHALSPKVFVLVEQDSSHNGPFFLGRFMEALHYYSAVFDSLDALLPRYDTRRAKVEQFYYAAEIRNILSCEGPARVERHERADQWRRRMSRAGFQASPVRMVDRVREWVEGATECEGFTLAEEKGCLVLGWKSKPIIAASCWKC